MKKKRIIPILLAVLFAVTCVCMFSGCTKKGVNMLSDETDGVLRYSSLTELQKDWILGVPDSVSDVSSVFTMNADEDADAYTLSVDTSGPGYAYLGKVVNLTAGAYYRITYSVEINSISAFVSGDNNDGVYVTFLEDDDFNYNPSADASDVSKQYVMQLDTGSGKYPIGFKAKSGGKATLALMIGSEDHPVNASVTVKSIVLERVDKSALSEISDAGTFATDYYGTHSLFNVFYMVVGGVAIALLAYFGYFLYQRHLYKSNAQNGYTGFMSKLSDKKYLGILFVVVVALIIRLLTNVLSTVIASTYTYQIMGYNLEGLTTQAMFIAKYGTTEFTAYLQEFATENSLTYATPTTSALQLYFLAFCGFIGRIFDGVGGTYFATMFFLRFFCALADIGTALIVYGIVRKKTGTVGSVIIASLFAILPTTFAFSSLWGYTESVTMFLIALVAYFMMDMEHNRLIPILGVYFAACMFSLSALFFAPFVLFYVVMQCIRNRMNILPASIALVLAFFVFYAINVPFDLTYIQNGKPFYCFSKVWKELYSGMLYTRNAFNFQAMLGNNFGEISTASTIVTIIFIVFLLALAGIAYFRSKNRMHLLLLASAFINMMFVFGNNMNPTSMYISLALMLIYAIVKEEKRIFFCFATFAILLFLNASYYELFVTYSATAIGVMSTNAVVYVFAAFEILFALYYVYIVYDIVVSNKVRLIQPMPLTYGEWLKNTGRKIKKSYYKLILKLQRKQ